MFLKKILKNKHDITHPVNNILLSLPFDHPLPLFQKKFPLYDTYLGFLIKNLNLENHLIIDVGANCADSLALMIKPNTNNHYVCIEPDPIFYNYLTKNILQIQKQYPDITIDTLKIFIGNSNKKVSLVTNTHTGTRSTIEANNLDSETMQSLDSVIAPYNKPTGIIKSDIDGFDYDVLFSADKILTEQSPVIYFECDARNTEQINQYHAVLDFLHTKNYIYWIAFDNFGLPILTTDNPDTIKQLTYYTYINNQKKLANTFHYCDILACKAPQKESVEKSLIAYNQHIQSLCV